MGVTALHAASPRPETTLLLLAVARHHDRRAFDRLFQHYSPRLTAYLRRSGADLTTCEDMAQEVMLLVWRKAEEFDPARASAGTWIFTIARHVCVDFRRRARRQPADNQQACETWVEPAAAADVAMAGHQRDQRLHVAIGQLPPHMAEIVRLSFFTDSPHPVIARQLGIPLGTVKSRMRSALKQVRASLDDGPSASLL